MGGYESKTYIFEAAEGGDNGWVYREGVEMIDRMGGRIPRAWLSDGALQASISQIIPKK